MDPVFLPVADAYDRWSSFYDHYDNPMVFMAAEIVERSIGPLAAGLSAFEFGCGTGRNLAALARHGAAPLAGCDLSAGMLQVAARSAPSATLYRQDMLEPVPLPDASLDLTLFSLTLEHIADLRRPLREARRITRPGGRIAIVEIHPFLSLTGLAAHFDDGPVEVRMPTFPHQFADYLAAFAALDLRLALCREWKPADVGNPPPLQSLKRGPEVPLTVEFSLLL